MLRLAQSWTAGHPFLTGEPIAPTLTGLTWLLAHGILHTSVEMILEKIGGLLMKTKPIFQRLVRAVTTFTKKLMLPTATLAIAAI
jgi:hypothetical protein